MIEAPTGLLFLFVMKVLIPTSFNLEKHIQSYPPSSYGCDKFDYDHALYLLSLITFVPARNKKITDSMKNGYTPLYSPLLQSFVHDYRSYLNYFIQTGVIETDNIYRSEAEFPNEGKSKGYRYTTEYCGGDIYEVQYGARFQRVLKKRRDEAYRALRDDYGHLIKWLWPECKLEIDKNAALEYLDQRRSAQLLYPHLQDTKRDPIFNEKKKKDPETQYRFAKANVELIASGNIVCTVDGTVGRMHTVLTNMKSDLRNLITYLGAPLVSIDIKNSQPYLSTILTTIQETKRGRHPLNTLKQQIQTTINQTHPNSSLMLEEMNELFDKQDFTIFKNLVSYNKHGANGEDLYTYMLKKGKELNLPYANRREAKEGMFEVLFSSNRHHSQAKRLFRELFPSVDKLFRSLKELDHSLLPRLLQKIESFILLRVVTKRIARRYPSAHLFTIHQSIVTTLDYRERVRTMMHDELTKIVGLEPKLKDEYWRPENIDYEKYQYVSKARERL